MDYQSQHIDFEFVYHFFMTEKHEFTRVQFLDFLRLNKEQIEDDAVVGLIIYVEKHDCNIKLLEKKLQELKYVPQPLKIKQFKRRRNNLFIKYAASLLLIIGIVFSIPYFLSPKPNLSSYFPIETGLPNLMNGNSDIKQLWINLNADFIKEDYNAVIQTCEKHLSTNPNDTLYYYGGIAAFKLKKYKKAITYFEAIQPQKASIFFTDSEYLLALSLLSAKEIKRGEAILQSIATNPNHTYHSQATELISRK